jgi:pyruvate dehydrogenase E1 component alpha subunit
MISKAREGGGPALLECKMIRFFGHFEGDAQTYRGATEVEELRANSDCIKQFVSRVTEAKEISPEEIESIDREAVALIQDALEKAKAAPLPSPTELTTDVYVSY